MKRLHRLHERLADRVSFIQYPNIKQADERTREASRTGLQFVHKMSWDTRIILVLASCALLLVGLAGLTVAGLVIYAVLVT